MRNHSEAKPGRVPGECTESRSSLDGEADLCQLAREERSDGAIVFSGKDMLDYSELCRFYEYLKESGLHLSRKAVVDNYFCTAGFSALARQQFVAEDLQNNI